MDNKIYDVIVVGAGLSGLQAAHDIQQAGLSCIVLEARDRVGGKTWSVPLANGKGVIDIGAAWTNDTNQSHIYAWTQRFGIELIKQNTEGDCVFHDVDGATSRFPYGTSPKVSPLTFATEPIVNTIHFTTAEVEDLERIRDEIHDLSVSYGSKGVDNFDQLSLEQFVVSKGGSKRTLDMIRIWSRVMLGVEASELSAQFFIEYNGKGGGLKTLRSDQKGGGQYLRFRKGTQQVARGLAGLLTPHTVQLSTPVKAITDTRFSVTVTTQSGKCFTARKLVLSIPTPLYNDISFSPPLSGDKLAITSGTQHGYYSKMILCYSSPWWTKTNCCGLAISYQTPVCVVRDTSVAADEQYSLTCFIGGAPGRAWSLLPQHERRSQVLKQVSKIYADEEQVYKPIEIFEQEWSKEEWSKGAPCPVTGPGLLTKAGAALKQSCGNLHFVGTETSDVWSGYMEGAVRSGVRGAKEVMEALGAGRLSSKL